MNLTKNTQKQILKNILPILIIGICSIFLFIRCFFSFTWSDESFYLTIVHRLWLGELMFIDEWYTTQLSAPLLLPFYSLYQWIIGDSEGVYLYFRILYWLFSTTTTYFVFAKLKKWNHTLTALFCSLIYLFYSRANIGGLSYYNTSLTLVLLGIVLIYGCFMDENFKRFDLFLTGIFFAMAVVIIPYLAVPYIGINIFLLLYKKTRVYWRHIAMVILGTSTTAIIYMIYILSKVSISDIILNIPHVLNEPELQKTNPILAIPLIFIRIAWRYKWTILGNLCLLFYICYKHYKKQISTSKEFKRICGINLIIFVINYYLSANLIGCVNIAFVLFGITFILYSKKWNSKFTKIIQSFGIGGISVIFSFTFSSDTGLDAMSIGFVILAIGMTLLLFQNEKILENQFLYRLIIAVITCVILQTAFLRLFSVYRDAPLNQLNTQLTSGPAKYLYTTSEHAKQYNNLQNDIATYLQKDDKIFYTKNCFWAYLCTQNEYGVPTSWRIGMDSPRLEDYYTLNPEKIPTCIFMLKPEYGNFESHIIQNNEKVDRPNENLLDGFLYDYIIENNYEVIDTPSSTIYRKTD